MNRTKNFLLGTTCIVAGSVALSPVAQAQLDEIVVTATKRERSLQDIPVSISAFSGEALELSGVTNIESFEAIVPGLSVQTTTNSGANTSVRLRGVGTTGNNLGFEGAVGIFVDGTYKARAGIALSDLQDIERIEVLRGPQGTLFGRNTTAGAISIITKRPQLDEWEAELSATFGNFNRTQVQGVVNFPIVDGKLAGRISANYNLRDGYGVSLQDPNDDINDRDRYSIKGQLFWAPTPDIDVRIIGSYFAANETCCGAVQFSDDGAFIAAANAGGVPGLVNPPPYTNAASFRNGNFATTNTPTTERQEDRFGQIDVSWDLPGGINFFNSVTYQRYDLGSLGDVDFTAIDFLSSDSRTHVEQFTEEFRFTGELNNLPLVQSVNWLAGGYYSSENLGSQQTLLFGQDAAIVGAVAFPLPGVALAPGDFQYNSLGQNAKVKALFGHLDIDIVDWLNLAGGARFTTEDKVGGGVFTTENFGAGINLFLAEGALPFEAPADADEWIGTVALTVNFNDDISAYTSFAHGYKSGGINFDRLGGQAGFAPGSGGALLAAGLTMNPALALGFTNDPTFPEETVNTYEVGLKSSFWDNRATFNITGFHSVFSNFQILSFTGASFVIVSADEATTTGFESELVVNPIDGLTVSASYVYADAEYSAPFALPGLTGSRQLGDSRLTNAPLHSASLTATYRQPIPNTGLVGLVHGEWAYNSNANTSTELAPDRVQNGYSLFNARIGVNTDDDRYGVQLWCRNCGDEQYRNIIFGSLVDTLTGGDLAFITPPREWGVTLTARY